MELEINHCACGTCLQTRSQMLASIDDGGNVHGSRSDDRSPCSSPRPPGTTASRYLKSKELRQQCKVQEISRNGAHLELPCSTHHRDT